MKDNTHARQGERRHEGTLRPTRTRLRGGGCHLDAEARLLIVLDNGAHECAVPLEMLEHHLAEHLAVGARPWVGASHEDSEAPRAQRGAQSAVWGDSTEHAASARNHKRLLLTQYLLTYLLT